MRSSLRLYFSLFVTIVLVFVIFPVQSSAMQCECEVEYTHFNGCSSDNINYPFTSSVVFEGGNGGLHIWDIMRNYLNKGYPEACDETSNIMRSFFLQEFEARVHTSCMLENELPERDQNTCFVVTDYRGNYPIIEARNTQPDLDLPNSECLKDSSGNIIRGCGDISSTLYFGEERTSISNLFVGDHNSCYVSLKGNDSTLNIEYRLTCDVFTGTHEVETPDVEQDHEYEGVPFSLPSTERVRAGTSQNVQELIGRGIRFVTGFFGSIALVMIIYGGLQIMFAQGSGDKVKQGTKIIIWASIGLIAMLASYSLVSFVLEAIKIG